MMSPELGFALFLTLLWGRRPGWLGVSRRPRAPERQV